MQSVSPVVAVYCPPSQGMYCRPGSIHSTLNEKEHQAHMQRTRRSSQHVIVFACAVTASTHCMALQHAHADQAAVGVAAGMKNAWHLRNIIQQQQCSSCSSSAAAAATVRQLQQQVQLRCLCCSHSLSLWLTGSFLLALVCSCWHLQQRHTQRTSSARATAETFIGFGGAGLL